MDLIFKQSSSQYILATMPRVKRGLVSDMLGLESSSYHKGKSGCGCGGGQDNTALILGALAAAVWWLNMVRFHSNIYKLVALLILSKHFYMFESIVMKYYFSSKLQ